MPWSRMKFRDSVVFVHVDEQGQPVLDADGRAEMKYRETDDRVYRPSGRNLQAMTPQGAGAAPAQPGRAAQPAGSRPPPQRPARAAKAPRRSQPPPHDPGNWIAVWTDGACTGNPGPMGIGMVVIGDGQRIERGEFLGMGTNNIAELVAIERGLDLAVELHAGVTGSDADAGVRVFTDSSYSIGVLSMGWKAKANRDLIERLRARLGDFPFVQFEKVAGHAGVPDNERCDELAREAIKQRATI